MGKKYIIELLDECNSEFKGIMVFGLTQEKQISVELIPEESLRPYTEPDLDAVRKEAYYKGYETAKHECEDCTKQAYTDTLRMDVYQKGLSDAWEAARKVVALSTVDRRKVFGSEYMYSILKNHTASEAIEKIRQYEESKEKHTWICSEVNEPSVDATLICSECGYTMKLRIGDTPALNFCPKCGDCKKPKEEKS